MEQWHPYQEGATAEDGTKVTILLLFPYLICPILDRIQLCDLVYFFQYVFFLEEKESRGYASAFQLSRPIEAAIKWQGQEDF